MNMVGTMHRAASALSRFLIRRFVRFQSNEIISKHTWNFENYFSVDYHTYSLSSRRNCSMLMILYYYKKSRIVFSHLFNFTILIFFTLYLKYLIVYLVLIKNICFFLSTIFFKQTKNA